MLIVRSYINPAAMRLRQNVPGPLAAYREVTEDDRTYCSGGTARMNNRNCLFLLSFFTMLVSLGIIVHESKADDNARGRVTTGINLRAAPGLAGKVITALETGTVVTITGEQSGWYQISYEDDAYGYRGWVYGKYIEKLAAAPVQEGAVTTAREHSQPAAVTPVQKSAARATPMTAAGDVRTLPPDMPTNTIELIQASKARNAAVTEPAVQIPQPEAGLNKSVIGKSSAGKSADLPVSGTDFREKHPPVKTETVTNTAAVPARETTAGTGPGNLLSLVLKISSVFLSCLALMISYKTFHLVTTGGQRSA